MIKSLKAFAMTPALFMINNFIILLQLPAIKYMAGQNIQVLKPVSLVK